MDVVSPECVPRLLLSVFGRWSFDPELRLTVYAFLTLQLKRSPPHPSHPNSRTCLHSSGDVERQRNHPANRHLFAVSVDLLQKVVVEVLRHDGCSAQAQHVDDVRMPSQLRERIQQAQHLVFFFFFYLVSGRGILASRRVRVRSRPIWNKRS